MRNELYEMFRLTDAMRVDDLKQKQNKNSLWAHSHASSHWWWMLLMFLREWDSRCASEAFTIKCYAALCPMGDKPCLWQKPLCRVWVLCEGLNTDWADYTDSMRVDDLRQKQDENTLCGILSCFEYMMVNVSAALTWMGFTTCIRDIYHQVLCSTLPTGR